jgi:hypothetical protein
VKLSSAMALAAQQFGLPDSQLLRIARTLAERRASIAATEPGPAPATDGAGFPLVEPDDHGESVNRSLRASQSLLTRTINMLK